MTLNLTITNPNVDYGRYYCVSKNEVGTTRGEIDVYGIYYFLSFSFLFEFLKKRKVPSVSNV